jgi:hypothetical protein
MAVSRAAVLWVLASIPAILLVVAAIAYNGLKKDQDLRADLAHNGQRVSGKIVVMRDGRRAHYIDMEFRTEQGRLTKARYHKRLASPESDKLVEGMIVDVVYDPRDPSRAIPAPFKTVPQRNVLFELLEFLRRISLTLLIVSPLIIGTALWKHKRVTRQASRQQ